MNQNSADPDQTAPKAEAVRVHTVCRLNLMGLFQILKIIV